jgi:predicted transcriptional regulator
MPIHPCIFSQLSGGTDVAENKPKDRVLEAVRELPEDATVEEAMEKLYFLAKVEEGLRQADAGQTMSAEEARKRILG